MLGDILGDLPPIRILDYIVENEMHDLSISEIMEGTGLSRPAVIKHVKMHEEHGVIEFTRKIGKTNLYQLKKGPLRKALLELIFTHCKAAMEKKKREEEK